MTAPGDAEDVPFEARAKKTPRKPNPWKKDAWIPTRLDWPGRKVIIAQCRVPDHFHQKDGTRIAVHPAFVKAVLYEIALWDKPGASLVSGNESVAHHTQIPLSVVNNAIAALKEAKILIKKRRGLTDTSAWFLDWVRIESLRVKFVPKKNLEKLESAEDEQEFPTDEEEQEFERDEGELELPTDQAQQPRRSLDRSPASEQPDVGESLTNELFGRFAMFKSEGKLSRQSILHIIQSLIDKFTFTPVQRAARTLENQQLAQVVNDGVKNSPGYLRRTLEKAITDQIAAENEAGDQEAEEEQDEDDQQPGQQGDGADEEERDMVEFFAAVWANKMVADELTPDGKTIWKHGPASTHLIPILREALADDDPTLQSMDVYIEYVFSKVGTGFRSLTLEKAAHAFVQNLPKWIVAYDKEFTAEEDEVPF
jgi:hypothetical protein